MSTDLGTNTLLRFQCNEDTVKFRDNGSQGIAFFLDHADFHIIALTKYLNLWNRPIVFVHNVHICHYWICSDGFFLEKNKLHISIVTFFSLPVGRSTFENESSGVKWVKKRKNESGKLVLAL